MLRPIVQEMLEIATDIYGFDVERAMREGEFDLPGVWLQAAQAQRLS